MASALDKKLQYLTLSQEEMIRAGAIDCKMALQVIEEALRLHSTGGDILPFKVVLRWGDIASEEVRGHINAMPAYVGGDLDVVGIKWIGGLPESAKRGQPLLIGIQVLNDAHTGWPLAIMDAGLITSIRTAAVAGIGIKYLAQKDSETVSIIGTGVEGRSHAMMAKEVLPGLREIRGFDIRRDVCSEWAKEMKEKLGVQTTSVNSMEEALRNADVIFTCAGFPRGPVPPESQRIKNAWVKPGAFIGRTAGPPLPSELLGRCSKIVVDDWQQMKHRFDQHSNPGMQLDEWYLRDGQIYGQLGEIISGRLRAREPDDDIIVLLTVGLGTEDTALAYRIYRNAMSMGLGTKATLWTQPVML